MEGARLPVDEVERLGELWAFAVLDTPDEDVFDALVRLAASVCGTPISLVSLVDEHRQWFKARLGLAATELPRDIAFCAHAILGDDILLVPDALEDRRFADNPVVAGDPYVRFYAGVPLRTAAGHALGTLCVIDAVPRNLSPEQLDALRALGRAANSALAARRGLRDLATAAEHLHAARRRADERFAATFEHAETAMALVGLDGSVLRVNPALCRLLGRPEADVRAGTLFELVHPDERAELVVGFGRVIGQELRSLRTEVRCPRPDGSTVWVTHTATAVLDESGQPSCVAVQLNDETLRRTAADRLAHARLHDPLTGLPNRALLIDRIDRALGAAGDGGVGLVLLDLDHFNRVNDALGHEAGNRALAAVAARLRGVAGAGDTVARIDGDTFAVLCPSLARAGGVRSLVAAVRTGLRRPLDLGGAEVVLTASIGVAANTANTANTGDERDAAALLRDAGAALYEARSHGVDVVEVFDFRVRARVVERLEVEHALRRALARSELTVHYQPEIDLTTGHPMGVEALLRWTRPTGEVVGPGAFLDVATEAGLIEVVDDHVLTEALAQTARWCAAGVPPGFRVWVNLSTQELGHEGFVERIATALAQAGVPARHLGLELTEHLFAVDSPTLRHDLAAVEALGVALALDDFGTGYSSLSYLQRMPFGCLKIDRSFVAGLGADPVSESLVDAIVALGHALGLDVVAEGVETEQQLAHLVRLGCDRAQGFLLGRPAPADQVEILAR